MKQTGGAALSLRTEELNGMIRFFTIKSYLFNVTHRKRKHFKVLVLHHSAVTLHC